MIKKIKKVLLNYAKMHHWFMVLLRKVRNIMGRLRYIKYYFTTNVDSNTIVFEAYMGRSYACSPKAIYEYMLNNKKYNSYNFIWFFKNIEDYKFLEKNKNTIVVKYKSKKYYQYYAKAKYWITNSRIPDIIIKKKSQKYIQCWHGTPLKKLGYDITVEGGNAMNSLKDIRKKYRIDAKKYDYMVSPSKFCSEKFRSAFNLKKYNKENIIIEEGYPRNDFLINYTQKDVDRVRKDLNIPKNKKIILYAPTWRDNQHESGVGYVYEPEINFKKLQILFGEDYILLFRSHYFIANYINLDEYKGFVYNVSQYDDINDLYIISDLLITDYSSVFFDYAILKRPIIFYMYDLKEYKNKLRDFYINLKELPGPIVENEKDLVKEIKSIDKNKKIYFNTYKKFNEKFNYLEDGNATERVVEKILSKG